MYKDVLQCLEIVQRAELGVFKNSETHERGQHAHDETKNEIIFLKHYLNRFFCSSCFFSV